MREIIKSLKRTPYQTLAAFLVLFFSLLLSGILFISLSFLDGLLHYVETRPQVIVYFQTKTPETAIFQLRDELINTGKVASIKYISKNEAYRLYKEIVKDNPLLLEMTSAEVLPASLEIYAKKPDFLPQIAEYLKNQPGVDEVQFQKNLVEKLLSLTSIVRRSALVLFIYLLIMSTIVLLTTTSFKIALKKDEIELLQLLGASKWYIKKPFVAESITLGLLTACISTLIIGLFMFALNPHLQAYLRDIPQLTVNLGDLSLIVWPFNKLLLSITFFITALFSIIVAFLASFIGTDRYINL